MIKNELPICLMTFGSVLMMRVSLSMQPWETAMTHPFWAGLAKKVYAFDVQEQALEKTRQQHWDGN